MIDQSTATSDEILYVATSIFNPEGTEIRYKLYRDFKAYISSFPNVVLVTLEIAFKDAPFQVTSASDSNNIQLRTNDILWYKENSLNIIFKTLPREAKVAWIDADISFTNEDWVNDTLKALDEFKFVQLLDTCNSLGPNGEVLASEHSFIYRWLNKTATLKRRGRSGLAWAAKVKTLEQIGWLIDWDIVGASDWFHVFALTNQTPYTTTSVPCKVKNEKYFALVKEYIDGSVTYITGTAIHYFHGYPSDRGYGTRGTILVNNDFDPDIDIGYREDGLMCFITNKPQLRSDIQEFFKAQKIHGVDDIPSLATTSSKA